MAQNFDDVYLARVELFQFVLRLQFAEEKLCVPFTAVYRRYLVRETLLSGKVRDVQSVVVGVTG